MNAYIDTSVLVAYYCPEPLSEHADRIMTTMPRPAISQLTEIELASALARKIREETLAAESGRKILSLFQTHIDQKGYRRLPIQPKHYTVAKEWISRFKTALRTLDALHLAIAALNGLPIFTADVKLAKAAEHFGMNVRLFP